MLDGLLHLGGYLLFGLAYVGHAYILMGLLNIVYAQPWHRTLLKTARHLAAILLVAWPVAVGIPSGFRFDRYRGRPEEFNAEYWLKLYLFCLMVAGLIFVIATVSRLMRRNPACVVGEGTTTIDIEKELGHRPVGDGKYRRVAAMKLNDLFNVDFTRLELRVPGLPPAWDGVTILHLSDLHFYGTPGRDYFDAVVRHCVADGPADLLVLSGDIVDGPQYLDWIRLVLEPLEWNVAAFAILGNHDWWQDADGVRERLASLGMKVVSNRWEAIELRGEPLVVIGHEGPWFKPPPDLANLPAGFRLLISHTPDNIPWAKKHDCRLMLSGHNHGGQIRLPIITSMFVPSAFSRRYDMGTFHEPPTVLHVNRGLSGKEPVRFRCNPQVTRITLRPM